MSDIFENAGRGWEGVQFTTISYQDFSPENAETPWRTYEIPAGLFEFDMEEWKADRYSRGGVKLTATPGRRYGQQTFEVEVTRIFKYRVRMSATSPGSAVSYVEDQNVPIDAHFLAPEIDSEDWEVVGEPEFKVTTGGVEVPPRFYAD